ncbi:MAG: glycosyl hydrolase family 8 [Paludibacteraceae bacterium]|nr:glycosyl hydrolase family 8 [Paludibacteraceae bacterium]
MNIRHYIVKVSLCVGGLLSFAQGGYATNEVTVHINSGNPKFPFPQFTYYEYGEKHKLDNLGTKNPEGVVHVEMEQDIRDAYQIFANEWEYTGESWGGVKYIRGNLGCPYDCREGDGYSLLAAAIMGDKVSFDGLWMCVHDKARVKQKRYIDGVVFEPDYEYGDFSNKDNQNSATDGDVDMAIALYIAWRQWGDLMGIDDFSGTPISYKKEFLNFLKGMVGVQSRFMTENPRRSLSGDIGFDGYLKNGDTWTEITDYATTNPIVEDGVTIIPEYGGPQEMHTDYLAPSYFHEFFDLLDELKPSEITEFEKNQFKRCAASCDWVVGNWIGQGEKNIFVGEVATIENNKVTLKAGNQGGRFRSSWRTAMNYMWHGNPTYTWDPVTHEAVDGSDTYEYDASVRFSKFMNDPQTSGNSDCLVYGTNPLSYKGPATLHWDLQPDGSYPYSKFALNWTPSCGLPSAISAQDLDLAAILYRHCNIEWDVDEQGDRYLTSVPHYFHGWFRLLGMLVATGNHIAPGQMATAKANMKVYRSLKDSMSLAYVGDNVKYYLDYRNFGSVDAKDVKIVENVPEDFIFVSATDGGEYDAATHTVTWKIGTVAGVKSDDVEGAALDVTASNLSKTMGQVSYIAKVGPNAGTKETKRYCTTAEITCSNGTGWISNEYPNHITATMQRNCVDVINRSLKMTKKANLEKVNPGNKVKYTINFENSSKEGWLEGGRPRVNVAFCNNGLNKQQEKFGFRLYSDAIEPYINYGNYRVSYFMYDPSMKCLKNNSDCPVGWSYMTETLEFGGNGDSGNALDVSVEKIVNGQDPDNGKKWNQRLIVRFPNALVTTTAHLLNQNGQKLRIHKGVTVPLRIVSQIQPNPQGDVNYADDWSWDPAAEDDLAGSYYPITPSVQKIDPVTGKAIEEEVNEYLPNVCQVPPHTVNNVLVEEYDGYVWRKILGNGPMAGREYEDVVILDTLPEGMDFVGFDGKCPLEAFDASWDSYQIADGRWVVKWEIPFLQREQKGVISYYAQASMPSGNKCPTPDEETFNIAWLSAKNESPLSDTAEVVVTCAKVPDPVVPTTITKSADKEAYELGDPITYEIEYEQTHGYVTTDAAAKASDWTLSGGASVSNGSVMASGGKAKHNYSYASNIYLEMDCEGYDGLLFYLRDDVKISVRKDWAFYFFSIYEGGEMLGEEEPITTNANKSNLKVDLTGNLIRIWFDSDTIDLPVINRELKSSKSGFFSLEKGTFSNIYLHTDYAYDLTFVDRKPAEVKFLEADNGGVLKGDSIVWEFEHGVDNPIPFGTKYKVSWNGTVDECSESIINVAYAKLLGHKDNEIVDFAESACGAVPCPLEKVTLKSASDVFCSADSMVIKATATAKGTYMYQWYNGEDKVGKATENQDSLVVREAGSYWVEVSVADDATCDAVKSKELVLTTDAMPETALGDTSACEGSTVELKAVKLAEDTYVYKWSDRSSDATLEVGEAGEYSVVVTNGTCVAKDTAKVTFGSETLTDVIYELNGVKYMAGDTGNVCPNTEATLTINKTSGDGTYKWSSKPSGFISGDAEAKQVTINPEGLTTYYVSLMGAKCVATDSFVVKVGKAPLKGGIFTLNGTDYPRSEGNSGSICPGEASTLGVNYTPKEGDFTWSSKPYDESMVADGASVSIKPDKKTTYYVSFMMDCEAMDSFVVDVKEPMELSRPVISLQCNAVKLTATATGSESPVYHWSVDGEEMAGTDASIVISGSDYKSGTAEVYATASDACQSETQTKDFSVVGMKAELSGSKTVCPGLTTELAVEAESELNNAKYSYQWKDKDGEAIASATSPTYKAGAGTFYVTVKLDEIGCDTTIKHVIVEGTGALETEGGEPGIEVGGEGVKNRTYYYCGSDAVTVSSNYKKDSGSDYEWTVLDASGNATSETYTGSASVTPVKDMAIALKFQNQCDAYDTLFIKIPEKVAIEPTVKALCGETSIEFSNTKPTYRWTYGTSTSEGKKFTAKLDDFPSASGSVTVTAEAEGYCPAETTLAIAIDTLGVKLTADESVCYGAPATLNATAQSSNAGATLAYSYASRPAGSNSVFKAMEGSGDQAISNSLTEATEFQVTVSDGVCEKTATQKVVIDIPRPDGVIRVDGEGISEDSRGMKTHKTCGEPFTISTTHNGTDYNWLLEGVVAKTGKEVELTPSAESKHTEQYVLSYTSVSGCPVTDTVNIEVTPLSASVDWAQFKGENGGVFCEGESTSATIELTGEATSIKWYRDGEEVVKGRGKTELSLTDLKAEDSGTYTYEVGNGLCTRTDAVGGSISVQKRVGMTVASTEIIVPRGEDGTVELTVDAADADIKWYDNTEGDHRNVGSGTPLTIEGVDRDYQLVVEVSAPGYCTDKMQVSILADAKAMVSLSADSLYNCLKDVSNRLTVDTAGTGKVRFPDKYKIEIMASTDGGETYTAMASNVVDHMVALEKKTTYKAVVTYGSQKAESDAVTIEYFAPAKFKDVFKEKACVGSEVEIAINNLMPRDAQVVWDSQEGLTGNGTTATAVLGEEGSHIFGYSIEQNEGKCRETFSAAIEAIAQIDVESGDTTICEGGSAKIAALSTGTPKYYHWYADGELVGTMSGLRVSPAQTTEYTVYVSNGYCDSVGATATVTVADKPVITSVEHRTVKKVEVLVEGGQPSYKYKVDSNELQDESEFTLAKYGVHTYYVVDLNGCEASATDTLKAPEIKVPQVVTSNGDGVNDAFEVPGMAEAYPDAKVKIFDRWGKQIAEYKASEGSWDGTYNGNKMPATDYWYEIYIPELYKYYTGHFTLMHE